MIKTVEFSTARQVADHITLLLALKRQFSCHFSSGSYCVSYPLSADERLGADEDGFQASAQRWRQALIRETDSPLEDGP